MTRSTLGLAGLVLAIAAFGSWHRTVHAIESPIGTTPKRIGGFASVGSPFIWAPK